ncbi:MAG TPA: LysM peptidoglycan-binding domain-containing protein [Steroidobacteraceae bacterium]|nr:LysM peptidoglycan-binding domain-containing protein [Steroidobacteraceae bacterium]
MLLNKYWCTGCSLTLLVLLSACASHKAVESPANSAPLTVASAPVTVAPEPTATEAATDESGPGNADTSGSETVISDASGMLNPTAPKDYVVRRGDTLWGISAMFLKDPWLWPEIWYVNPQVQNPHLIYPGDTLHLAYGADGKPQIQLERGSAARLHPQLRSTDLGGPISTIPYDSIAGFFSKPGVLSNQEAHSAPYVLALADDHQIAGKGREFYARRLKAGAGERFLVMHLDQKLKDPQGGRSPGYLAIYAGAAQVERAGDSALLVLTDSAREVKRGDVLIPDLSGTVVALVPHAPTRQVSGEVMAIVNGVLLAGQWQVVALNRGSAAGLEPGDVLKAEQAGNTVVDHCADIANTYACRIGHKVKLPAEVSGTLLVFKTYDDMSYALVLDVTRPLSIGDRVRNP